MPLPAEEVLEKLIKAVEEAKQTTSDLHSVRGDGLEVIKKYKKTIADAISLEIEQQIALLVNEAREQMNKQIDVVIVGIMNDWRSKLGLAP